MRRIISLLVCFVIVALFCSCTQSGHSGTGDYTKTITVINGIAKADIWILSQTESSLKTTVWGEASASGVEKDARENVIIGKGGDDGLYIFRMIDTENNYYSANGIVLDDGFTVELESSGELTFILVVKDCDGKENSRYELFSAKL